MLTTTVKVLVSGKLFASPGWVTETVVVPAALIVAVFPDMEMTLVSGTEKVKLDVLLDVGVAIRVNVPPGE